MQKDREAPVLTPSRMRKHLDRLDSAFNSVPYDIQGQHTHVETDSTLFGLLVRLLSGWRQHCPILPRLTSLGSLLLRAHTLELGRDDRRSRRGHIADHLYPGAAIVPQGAT